MNDNYDFLIIGCGIMGLCIAREIKARNSKATVLIIDKETEEAFHASSRNSGVLHAGFYYTADSLKAKLTINGNRSLKAYCRLRALPVNECGKLVVAQNKEEVSILYELEKRGQANGSMVSVIDEHRAREIEPNIKTCQKALYSPETASIDPKVVCRSLKNDLLQMETDFSFNTKFLRKNKNHIVTDKGEYAAGVVINCAGLYADKIAHQFGFGKNYTIIPFKGLYLKYTKNKTDVRTNIYPVPNLKNPFLGVHFTKMVDGSIKIGPTAIPALWRENYTGFDRFDFTEFLQVASNEAGLFFANAFGFRDLAFEEMRKYNKNYFVCLAQKLVMQIDPAGFSEFTPAGIRAQLLDIKQRQLVSDFVIEGNAQSVHILNAVSPAFTCALPFASYVVDRYVL